MNDDLLFAFLRRKKREWSGARTSGLTQAEVDELNAVLKQARDPADLKPDVPTSNSKGPLTAIVGAIAATSLFASIPKEEGTKLAAYRDIVGVPTICSGETKNVRIGMVETAEGCRKRLEMQLAAFAGAVMQCSPTLGEDGRDYQRAAAVSLAYNIGAAAYCRSTVDRRFDAGDFKGGCNAFLLWNKAGGHVVRGLADRRERERQICLKGVA